MRYEHVRMVPQVFPHPMAVIYFTGALEFLGALGLLLPRLHAPAAVCLMLLLVAMFPANIKAARERLTLGGRAATPLWLRLPLQLLLIGLLWWSSRS